MIRVIVVREVNGRLRQIKPIRRGRRKPLRLTASLLARDAAAGPLARRAPRGRKQLSLGFGAPDRYAAPPPPARAPRTAGVREPAP